MFHNNFVPFSWLMISQTKFEIVLFKGTSFNFIIWFVTLGTTFLFNRFKHLNFTEYVTKIKSKRLSDKLGNVVAITCGNQALLKRIMMMMMMIKPENNL
ncbi:hypothetical protein CRM22_002024 [Opisthorchis felineus]|uniref:Uncharacterized protein n=1 Tax=Opisthorchis felineus TaxID=147828 RepID=A0A4S2M876_OPIFE|nr:hypothetical protein CRM22_002024 [Opisthorchis felineus]